MSPESYLSHMAASLVADGSTVTTEQLRGGPVLVGYQSQFKVQWMATKMHLFTVAFSQPLANASALEAFTNDALDFAVRRKGALRGLQNGVCAIPVLIATEVHPDAVKIAEGEATLRWGAFAWPTVVDLNARRVYSRQGTVVAGAVYAPWIKKRIAATVLPPTD